MNEKIIDEFHKFGINIDDRIAEKLYVFYKELIAANETLNLTAITEFDEVVIKHFLDSASILCSQIKLSGKKIIDVGTGAGFPGLVLAILCPDSQITLLETLNKRCRFLQDISLKLELNNVKIVCGRAEDFGKNIDYREKFDYSLSRAVANLNILSEYLLPFVRVGGYMVAYKGKNVSDELDNAKNSVDVLGGKFGFSFSYELPNNFGERVLLFIEKKANSSNKFPRKAGIPSKRPL